MKLLVPVTDIQSAVKQIEAGANEIYLGINNNTFNNFSFNGRAKYNVHGNKISPDIEEFKEIVQHAHENGVFVMLAANTPFLANDPDGEKTFEKNFLNYVEQGIGAGVDSVILGDIGAILLLNKNGVDIHKTASTFLESSNKGHLMFFEELGVKRIVLSYQIKLEEIIELSKLSTLEFEVFGHYGCSFYDGHCNLKHSFGENIDSGIGIPCQNKYKMLFNEKDVEGQLLNASLVCSICSLPALYKAGIGSLKLVGRAFNMEQNLKITGLYSEIIKMLDNTNFDSENAFDIVKVKNEILPKWWINRLCAGGLCKHFKSSVIDTFVG